MTDMPCILYLFLPRILLLLHAILRSKEFEFQTHGNLVYTVINPIASKESGHGAMSGTNLKKNKKSKTPPLACTLLKNTRRYF